MNPIKRKELLSTLQLLRPALAGQSFVPAWTHILLLDGFATAYNDATLITVKVPLDKDEVAVCVPGELFIKTLSSFTGDALVLQEIGDGAQLLVQSGKSKIKVPTLPVEDFKMPKSSGSKPWTFELTDEILKGIAACRFSVGTDTTHPAQMGVTLGAVDGKAVLYSTDNITISRFETLTDIDLPGDTPVVLPTFFCDQLAALNKAYPSEDLYLDIYAGAVAVRFGSPKNNVATLFTKTLVDLEPLDFETIIANYLDVNKLGHLAPIPETMDAAFSRALLVLSAEVDKSTLVTVEGDELQLHSKSPMGESNDSVEWLGKSGKCRPFYVDPSLVVRAAKICEAMAVYARVMLLASKDGQFIHLIAHCNG